MLLTALKMQLWLEETKRITGNRKHEIPLLINENEIYTEL